MGDLRLQHCRLDGRYDMLECLGRGSYAEIYVARDKAAPPATAQMVVIKALNLNLQGALDPDLERTLLENFQQEAVALDRVRHPQIISRLGHGTAIDLAGQPFHYLVLEYMPGGDMAALCRRRPLPLDRALHYLGQVAAGLAHAHAKGVIHRDIKPQNLLLSADLQVVKIADFGVAKIGDVDGAITRVGTDVYAAPEHNPLVRTGTLETGGFDAIRPHLTPAADVYSLAKTTYMLLTGESPRRFAQKQITDLPPDIAGHTWAPAVLKVLRRATDRRAEARQQSVEEFWFDLRDAAMPATIPLKDRAAAAPPVPLNGSPRAAVAVADTPPRPRFSRAADLLQPQVHERLRIVVPITGTFPAVRKPPAASGNGNGQPVDGDQILEPAPFQWQRLVKIMLPPIFLLVLAGVLLATHRYFSARWNPAPAPVGGSDPAPAARAYEIGREYVTNNRVNLRSGPGIENSPLGVVEPGSRVRVLKVQGNWVQVMVIQSGGAKKDPAAVDQGWINSQFAFKREG
jgi:serine/threonine protein kinase